jgi:hypothetical protein
MDNKIDLTAAIREISLILTEVEIKHFVDPRVKSWGGKPYIGIYRSPRRLFFTHFYEDSFIEAMTPRILPPTEVEKRYGIKGEVDKYGDDFYGSRSHYVLHIPITGGKEDPALINGNYMFGDKKSFFTDIAKDR